MTRADQEQVAKVALGALAQALLLDRAEYLEVLRDHATATTWMPAGAVSCRSTRIRSASSSSTSRKACRAAQVSLPVQGTVAAEPSSPRAS